MSSIDKDPKSKVSKPSGKKFRLGFKDGFTTKNLPLFVAMLSDLERQRNK
jgi:hypothetical protein